MSLVIHIPKPDTLRRRMQAMEHPGRRTDGRQSAASWIVDLLDLKKLIILCSFCRVKFNPRKHHYRKLYRPDHSAKTDGFATNGRCDGCKEMTANCGGGVAFVHEETYRLICIDPVEARRAARAKARMAIPLWTQINRMRKTNRGSYAPLEGMAKGG